jgi:hypothetical protein
LIADYKVLVVMMVVAELQFIGTNDSWNVFFYYFTSGVYLIVVALIIHGIFHLLITRVCSAIKYVVNY